MGDVARYLFEGETMADKFQVYLQSAKQPGQGAYLSHKGRSEWRKATARKHLRDVVHKIVNGETPWATDYKTAVLVPSIPY